MSLEVIKIIAAVIVAISSFIIYTSHNDWIEVDPLEQHKNDKIIYMEQKGT